MTDDTEFSGRSVLVTGGTSGLGLEAVVALAERGARVTAGYQGDEERADALRKRAAAENLDIAVERFDVTDSAAVDSAVEAAIERFGPIEILVNSAGINRSGMVHRLPPTDWADVLSVNLTGPFHCMRAVIPGMKAGGGGRIINIGSVQGFRPDRGVSNYSASKGGLASLTRAAAVELAGSEVTVNMLSPGYFEVGMIREVPEPVLEMVIASTPVKRLGRAREFVHALLFLAAPDAAFVTGHILHVNGGLYG